MSSALMLKCRALPAVGALLSVRVFLLIWSGVESHQLKSRAPTLYNFSGIDYDR